MPRPASRPHRQGITQRQQLPRLGLRQLACAQQGRTLHTTQTEVQLDEVIGLFSQNWRIDRIGRVELTLLRIAVYEMLYRIDVPPKVAINEALELSKQFGDANARGFINGILDAAAKALEGGQLKPRV